MAAAVIGAIGLGLQAFGMGSSRRAAKRAARRKREEGELKARQLEDKAGDERAIGSFRVADIAKEGERIKSRAKAIGAASGAGGYEDNLADIEAEAEYRMMTALFNSEMSARDLELSAKAARKFGADSAAAIREQGRADQINAIGGIFDSALSLYDRYGRDYKKE